MPEPPIQSLIEALQLTQEKKKEESRHKITIISPVHNQLHHTKKFIDSIRRFTKNDWKLIIINNASTDETKEYFTQSNPWNLCTDKQISVLHESLNLGWVGAINKALDYVDSDTDYIIFANNDVIVEPNWDTKLLAHFDPTVGAVGPSSNYVAGRQSVVFNHAGLKQEEQNFLIGFFFCVPKSIVDQIGPLDDLHSFKTDKEAVVSGGDDIDYSIRIRNLGYRLLIARDVFVYHAGSTSLKKALTDQEYAVLCSDAEEAIKAKWGEEIWQELLSSPIKVLCAVPMRHDYCHRKFTFTFSSMIKPFHFECCDIPRAHISSARNAAVKFAQDGQFTHILFLDDDHRIPSDTFLRLYNIDKPVAAGLAFRRVPPFEPVVGDWGLMQGGQLGVFLKSEYIKTGVRKVDATGFAAVLIRMSVFEELTEKKLDWFKWGELGEDFSFCLSCKDAGIDVYCDTDLILPHFGDVPEINEETYYAANPQEVRK